MKLSVGVACAVACSVIAVSACAEDVVLEDDLVVSDFSAQLTDNYSGAGGIVVAAPFGTNLVSFTGYVQKTAAESTTVISNAWYLDVIPVSAKTGGGAMTKKLDYVICHRKEPAFGDTSVRRVTYQFQNRNSTTAGHIKTVKMVLEQQGSDVVVYASGAYYFETKEVEGKSAAEVAGELMGVFDMDDPSQWDYCKGGSAWYAGTAATSDSEAGNGCSGYGIQNLTFAVRCQTGLVFVEGLLEHGADKRKTVAPGGSLDQFEILEALSAGDSVLPADKGLIMRPYFERADGANRTAQFQFREIVHVKALWLTWGMKGSDLCVWSDKYGRYKTYDTDVEAKAQLGKIELDEGNSSNGWGGYLASNIYFRVNARTAVLSGTNTYEGVTLVDGPATLTCKGDDHVLPAGARIVVTNGATLVFNAKVEKPTSLAYNECGIGQTDRTKGMAIEVAKDSVFRIAGDWNVNDLATIVIDGGRFEPNRQTIYMPNLTLLNGGVVEGSAMFRMGASANSFLLSGGEAGCTNEVRSDVRHYNRGEQFGNPWTITTDADLVFSGAILYGTDNGWHGLEIVKDGAASLILANANSHRSSVTVKDGTLVLAHEEAMTTNMPLVIDGGTVTVAAGVSNEVKSVALGANGGTLVLEAGAVLKADAWGDFADGATLKVRAADGAKFYVPRLTSAARAALRWDDGTPDGQCVHRESDGSLAPGPVGCLIIFR